MGPSERSKMLLQQLQKGELTQQEFLKECAYWALAEGFGELRPRTIPTKPPRVVELEAKYKDRLDVDWAEIYSVHPEVKGYYELDKEVKHWNKGTKEWLQEMLTYIPEWDIDNRKRIIDRLKEFEDPTLEKVKEVFGGHVVD